MENQENSPEEKTEKWHEEAGSSRAVASGAYFFLFAIVGSITLWIFNVIATSHPGLAYFGFITAFLGIVQLLATGFGHSFISRVKAAYIEDPKVAVAKASSYIRMYVFLGFIIAIGIVVSVIVLALFIPDPFLQICLLMALPPMLLTYSVGLIGNMISVKNRFDIAAFIGSFYGVVVFIVGGILVWSNTNAVYFTLIPLCVGLNGTILTIIFYRKVSPFTLKELYTEGKTFSKESTDFLKTSLFATLTNLESIGVLGSIIVVVTYISLTLSGSSTEFAMMTVAICTIIITYVIAPKVAIIFFAGPINVEIAEAIAKEDQEVIQQTITDIGRISILIGFTLLIFLCAGAGHLLRILHLSIFQNNGGNTINENLLLQSQIVFICFAIGQASYGFAALFGNALIGAGKAKYPARGFGITLILTVILTPILIILFGFAGAGLAMLITGLFVLPYMLLAVKKNLNVKLNFKFCNHIPHLTIVYLIILFYPLKPVLDHITLASTNYPIALLGLLLLGALILAFLGGIPFFGVLGPDDVKLFKDMGKQFNLEWLSHGLLKLGRFFYYLNPLHKKSQK